MIFKSKKTKAEEEALKRLNESIGTFFSEQTKSTKGLIHDIRNPLSYSMTAAQLMEIILMKKEFPEKEKICEYFKILKRGHQEIIKILECALDDELDIQAINLKELLSYLVSNFQNSACHGERIFELNYSTAREIFDLDETKILRAVENLVTNAIKHTLKGMIIIEVIEDNEFLVISVKDSGSGIKKEVFEKIFEFQNTTEKNGIHGLGLWNVKRIAEMHHGKVEALTTEGVGTIIKVLIPLKFKGE